MLSKRGTVARIYLPPDANCLLSVADHCLRSRDYVNLIVIDKQPQLQWLDMDAARRALRARGVGLAVGRQRRRRRARRRARAAPATSPTLETVAAAWWLRRHAPELRVRVVNVVDLMTLFPPSIHPHGMPDDRFVELFTADKPVVFAFHGYQRAVHQTRARPPDAGALPRARLQRAGHDDDAVRHGRAERNEPLSPRIEALRRASRLGDRAAALIAECAARHRATRRRYAREHFEDPPEIRDWVWSD